MASVSRKQIEKDLTEILKHADLTKMSAKKVRQQLGEKYSQDLTDRKKEIDEILMHVMEARDKAKDEDSGTDDDQKMDEDADDNSNHGNISASDSEAADSDFEEPADMSSSPRKKKLKTPEKAAQMNDEELARQLQEEEGCSMRRTRGASSRKTQTKKAPQKRIKKSESPKKKNQGYLRSNLLSPALAQILGTDRLPRNNVVKKMWEIAKERDLFDPKNKQFIICDDELYKVFRRKRVRMFGCMKYLADHILSQEEEDQIV